MDHRGHVSFAVDDLAKLLLPKGTKILDAVYILTRRHQLQLTVEHPDLPEEGPTPKLEVEYSRKATIKGWRDLG